MFKTLAVVMALPVAAFAAVFAYECNVLPPEGGWDLVATQCDPEEWLEDGLVVHHVEPECEPEGDRITYRRYVSPFVAAERFFVEWRMMTDGSSQEFPAVAPAVLVAGGQTGVNYHFTISRDLIRLIRDVGLPYVYVEITPGVPHRYRLEHYGDQLYAWYIDGVLADAAVPEGFYPSNASNRVTWATGSWYLESTTQWDYIRIGRIAGDFSGDYDSSGTIDHDDFYFFTECVQDRGNVPGVPSDPGCVWADMDADGDVDFHDFAPFQRAFTGPQ